MKKIIERLLGLLLTITVSGCTLMLDEMHEPEIPEEERGVGEPYHVQTDFADITYQLNDGVRLITKNVMQYFVSIESDSILYFMDNCPSQWLPEEGGCMQIGVNEKFPMGYAGKVLERTHQNGMLRFVTTGATVEEIFKELEYVADVSPTFDIPDGDCADDHDSTEYVIDYSLVADEVPELYAKQTEYRWADKAKAQAARRKSKGIRPHMSTRASNDEDVNEPDSTGNKERFKFYFDSRTGKLGFSYNSNVTDNGVLNLGEESSIKIPDAATKKINELCKKVLDSGNSIGVKPFLNVEYSTESQKTYHSEYSSKRQYTEQSTTEISTSTIKVELGVEGGFADSTMQKKLASALQKKSGKTPEDGVTKWKLWESKRRFFSIYPPLALFFKLKPEVGFNVNLSISGAYEKTTTTTLVTGSCQTGKEKPKSIKTQKTEVISEGLGFYGSFVATIYGTITAGLSIASVLDFDVNATVAAGIEIQRSPRLLEGKDEYYNIGDYITPVLQVTLSTGVTVHAFAWDFELATLTILDRNLLSGLKNYYYPSLPSSLTTIPVKIVKNETGNYAITASYTFDKSGYMGNIRYHPHLWVYKSKVGDMVDGVFNYNAFSFNRKCVADKEPENKTYFLNLDNTYNFSFIINGKLGNNECFVVVPVLYDSTNKNYVIYNSVSRWIEVGEPSATWGGFLQTRGYPLSGTGEGSEFGINNSIISHFTDVFEWEASLHLDVGTKIKEVCFDTSIYKDANMKSLIGSRTYKYVKKFGTGTYRFLMRNAITYNVLDDRDYWIKITPSYTTDDGTTKKLETKSFKISHEWNCKSDQPGFLVKP